MGAGNRRRRRAGRPTVTTVTTVTTRILIVQHGDKERRAGDPGLTRLGHDQARLVAERLARLDGPERPVALRTSPLRRARETAAPIAAALHLEARPDDRLRERMNWDDDAVPFADFLADWEHATDDRTFVPRCGDSSRAAADRFLAALDDLASTVGEATAVVVAHGGVTVDTLRTVLGDDALTLADPTLIDDGVPSAAITTLRRERGHWTVEALPTDAHLDDRP